ncbi:hypothetical protein PPACK8108_LOCUS598 [Phakopsora pachyrhizi]|uniref:Uncharacterized protein n=1 Tax=Phakopsora pachyrhizi TaxID=170000 RepID=A0AAV0AGJ1_PHAPC|nr:hypothetical protein PPACK8108_LOCUS598 [Phakopsora pachyrhizi]
MAANTSPIGSVDPALINGLPGLLSLINAPLAPAVVAPINCPRSLSHDGQNLPHSWTLPTPPSTPAVATTTIIKNIPVPAYDLAMGQGLGEIPQLVPAVLSNPDTSSVSSEPQFLGADCTTRVPFNLRNTQRSYGFPTKDVFEYARHHHISTEDVEALFFYLFSRLR